jgi:hypothetical protein
MNSDELILVKDIVPKRDVVASGTDRIELVVKS